MKNYLIEEQGQYEIKINVDAENEEEATVKLNNILYDELPLYIQLEPHNTQLEEYNERVKWMNPMDDFEYRMVEIFGEPIKNNPALKRVNELKNHMIDNDIGSLDKIDQNNKSIYFKAYRHTPKQAIIPYIKSFKRIGWILYVRW